MSLFETISEIIKYVEMAFVYSMVGIRTIVKNLPISSFSLSVSSAIAFSDAVSKILDSSSNFIRSIEYIKPVMELMSLKEMDNTKG